MKSWMVRPGDRGQREKYALKSGKIVVGWGEIGDLSGTSDLEGIRETVRAAHPEITNALLGNWSGQLDRFVHQMAVGDIVVMPSKLSPGLLHLGRVTEGYRYDERDEGFRHTRGVAWVDRKVQRSTLGHDLRASLGSLLTVCELARNDAPRRLAQVLDTGKDPGSPAEDASAPSSLEALRDEAPVDVTIRHLLTLQGVHRRTASTIAQIVADLADAGLETATSLADGLIDEVVHVRPITTAEAEEPMRVDYRVSTIPSAACELQSVAPDDDVAVAQTKMLEHNFSQLPVLGEGGLAGVVTWSSIAMAALRGSTQTVQDAMEQAPPVVSLNHDVLDLVTPVERHGYVFVHGDEAGEVVGIVTIADLASAFGRDRRPLMLVEEIELRLRRAVHAAFTDDDVKKSKAVRAQNRRELTFGSYPRLLQSASDWDRLGWKGVEQARVLDLVGRASKVRNSLMHFSQDPPAEEDISVLEGVLRILRAVDRDRGGN